MTQAHSKLLSIPTNIITGFLGVGKTSSILHLLAEKPSNENWAVLVNEFGEIGIDGSLFAGQHSEQQGIFIREVPGGCMCCAAGLPMQIALNELLQRANPDRLLIEPTGLGHPKEVLAVLSAESYHKVLDLQKIITLVDARKLSDARYTEHETFNQQIEIADLVVANKSDLYAHEDVPKLEQYLSEKCLDKEIIVAQNGNLDFELLRGKTRSLPAFDHHHHHHHHQHEPEPLLSESPLPESGYLKAQNQGEGYFSVGWRFSPKHWFDREKLFSFFCGLDVERMKAVFITSSGIFAYNLSEETLSEMELDDCLESRVEIISTELDEQLEEKLFACLSDDT